MSVENDLPARMTAVEKDVGQLRTGQAKIVAWGADDLQGAFFGSDGPLGGLPGYDACAQAMCGLMS
ncbi:hypothetical protein, partial [Achromobacter marplatensis]|uniref:hypothetical protein n=1 Tax=Achromobacter marplatensis TaxID=470868 RepID=UPI000277F9F6